MKNLQSATDKQSEDSLLVKGVLILGVAPGSTAQKAGINKGDVIVKYDGTGNLTIDTLTALIKDTTSREGTRTHVAFVRDGQEHSVELSSGRLGISAMDTSVSGSSKRRMAQDKIRSASFVPEKYKKPEEFPLEWVPTSDWNWLKSLVAEALPKEKTFGEKILDPTKIPTYLVSAGIPSLIAGVIAYFNAHSLMENVEKVLQLVPETIKPPILTAGPNYPGYFVGAGIIFIAVGLLWSLSVPRPDEPQAKKAKEALDYMTKIETQAKKAET